MEAPVAAGPFSSPEKRTVILVLLVLATLVLYNPASRHPFVNFDDDGYVTENPHVKAGFTWSTVQWAFTTTDRANWHPVTWLSHALDCQLFGLNPAGHHDSNILLQAANAVLLFLLLQWTTGFTWRSLAVAALFAFHPVNVESVAWIAERKNLLSMLFFLLALWSYAWYARKPAAGRYATVVIFFVLGIMAKPQIITFPFVLLLWDYWPLGRMGGSKENLPKPAYRRKPLTQLVLEKVPLLLISVASGIITMKAQQAGGAVRSMVEVSFSARVANALVAYARYIGKAVWPSRLALLYPLPSNSWPGWEVVAATTLLLAITVAVLLAHRQRYLAVGWFWFLGTLVPMIGLVQVGEAAMADRYAYLPFLGLFLMLCWGVAEWAAGRKVSPQWLAIPAIAGLVALAAVTHVELGYWGNNVALWSHTVAVTGENFVAQDNLGGALLLEGKVDQAIPHFRLAAQMNPQDPLATLNLANFELRDGHLQAAVDLYQKVLQITADNVLRSNALSNLGSAYRRRGSNGDAEQSYEESLRVEPQNVRAWIGLGLLAEKSGDFAQAANDFSRAVETQPTDVSYLLLSEALAKAGRAAEAQAAAQSAEQNSRHIDEARKEAARLLAE
jgi:tetratricopeptide (TPR) repeat protein